MGLLTFQYFSLASVSDMDPESSTFCPGVGAMKILRSLTEPEAAAESPAEPEDDDDGKSSREIRMARYLERCSTRAVVVVLMNLQRNGRFEGVQGRPPGCRKRFF